MDIEDVINYLWDESVPMANGQGGAAGKTSTFIPFNGAYLSIDNESAWGRPDPWILKSVDMRAIDYEPADSCTICADGGPMWISSRVARKIPPEYIMTKQPTVETRITSLVPGNMLNPRMRNKYITQRHFILVDNGRIGLLPQRERRFNNGIVLQGRVKNYTFNETTKALMSLSLQPMAFRFQYRYHASMKVPVGDLGSVRIPMSLQQLREVLADRDKPETGMRRKALLHIVKGHTRTIKEDEAVAVREHLRGKISCSWRGHDITLEPSRYDSIRLKAPTVE